MRYERRIKLYLAGHISRVSHRYPSITVMSGELINSYGIVSAQVGFPLQTSTRIFSGEAYREENCSTSVTDLYLKSRYEGLIHYEFRSFW